MKSTFGRMCLALVSAALVATCATAKLHQQGIDDFDHGHYEAGLQKLTEAAAADPGNLTYKLDVTSRRDEAISKLIAAGDRARFEGDLDTAAAAYQRVLGLNSGVGRARRGLEAVEADRRHNQTMALAQQDLKQGNADLAVARLSGILAEDPGHAPAMALRAKIEAAHGPVTVTPKLRTRDNRPVTLQFRDAQTKMVFEVLSRQTGINFIFDKDIRSDGKTTIYVQDVPIEQAIDLVLGQNQLARQVLADNMVLIYPNTPAKQKDYQDQIVKTFYLNTAVPKDVEGLLKTVLGSKTLVVNERASAIIMRDTPENVRMAEKLVASIDVAEPEVMLEVEILEISRGKMQQLGIAYPGTATLSATSPSGGKILTLEDLQNQNSSTITVTPISVTLDALKTSSAANLLASPRIRARNKEKAKVLIGSKVPVITTAATASGNGGVVSNTQVQYLDVGLTLEVEPTIYADNDVGIAINLIVSSISNTVQVGDTIAYELRNRNATTLLQLKDGETQILAGLINDAEIRSARSVPGLGDIPLLGRLFSDNHTQKDKSELVMSITPHVIRAKGRAPGETTEFWYGTESRSGLEPVHAGAGGEGGKTSMNSSPPLPAAQPTARASVDVNTSGAGTVVGADSGTISTSAAADGGTVAAAGVAASTPVRRATAYRGASVVPATAPMASDGPAPQLAATVNGPGEVKAGDEFSVTLQLQTDQNVGHLRAQLRFDATAIQFVSADAGAMVASANPQVTGRPGAAQLDATATAEQPFSGSGELLVVKFKALQPRPQTVFSGQVMAVGPSGAVLATGNPTPLTMSVSN